MTLASGKREFSAPDLRGRALLAGLLALLLAPSLVLAYLPMTDLPQHLAVASILLHRGDPRFGFDAFYEPAFERSLYVLPYLGVLGLAKLVPLEAAMRAVVVLALAALPVGIWAMLRALGKPEWLALLALPLVYNRAFFWGFVNFELALGMALLALALLVRPHYGRGSALALAALCAALVFTHPYGVAVVVGYVFLWLLIGERRELRRRSLALLPLLLGAIAWALRPEAPWQAQALDFEPLLERLDDFEESVLGGYRDASEAHLMIGFLLACGALAARAFPGTQARWRALSHHERVLWAFVAVNAMIFAVVPANTTIVGELHMRHALIATLLLPLLASHTVASRSPRLARALLAGLALAAIANAWVHLIRFDREARGFDRVVEQIPYGSRIVALNWDANGAVMRTRPYWHFAAYAQARRGGLIAESFPRMFWNIPVRGRRDAGIPVGPPSLASRPYRFDYEAFGFFYDTVLVRRGETRGRDHFAVFPYELVFEAPPWQLWRARGGAR